MFAGELVEDGESLDLMATPAHPYTRLLLSAVPDPERTGTYDPLERAALRAAMINPTSCAFDGDAEQRCSATEPVRHRVGDPANPTGCAATSTGPRPGGEPRPAAGLESGPTPPTTRENGDHRMTELTHPPATMPQEELVARAEATRTAPASTSSRPPAGSTIPTA